MWRCRSGPFSVVYTQTDTNHKETMNAIKAANYISYCVRQESGDNPVISCI